MINKIKAILRPYFKVFKKKHIIPEYEEKREIILGYKKQYNPTVLVETGTFMGDTVQSLINEFDHLYSIELSDDLAARAKTRFTNDKHVTIMQGSSDAELPAILSKLTLPALFWLDGHYSGEFMYNDEFIKTAKGDLNTPVVKELALIFATGLPHVVLIDDARMFTGHHDYPSISFLKKMLKSGNIKRQLTVARDIIRIVPVIE
jgi:hypothetical protein